jgi:chromosome partitioning related protein ParA
MAHTFAFISTKGGVGKTTLCANLGGLFADFGLRVLLIDADVQPSLSKYYELAHEAPHGLVEMVEHGAVETDCISRTTLPNLDLVRSNDGQARLQHWLHVRPDRRTRLRDALRAPLVEERYDFVFVDTQGAVGTLQTAAAFAADTLISPLPPDTPSAREFRSGTLALLGRIEEDDAEPTARLAPIKALICRLDRSRDARLILADLRAGFESSDRVTILDTVVPNAVAYREAFSLRIPAHRHERRSLRAPSAFEVMHRVAWEIQPDLRGLLAGGMRADPSEVFRRLRADHRTSILSEVSA